MLIYVEIKIIVR